MIFELPTLDAVAADLREAGELDDVDALRAAVKAVRADPSAQNTPWYLRVLVGVSGFIAALFVVGWAACLTVCGGQGEGAPLLAGSLVVGLVSSIIGLVAAVFPTVYGLGRARRWEEIGEEPPPTGWVGSLFVSLGQDFFAQVGLVGLLAAQLGEGIALGVMTNGEMPLIAAVMIVQNVVLLVFPHPVQSFVSVWLIGVWSLVWIDTSDFSVAMDPVIAAFVVATAVIWLVRPLAEQTPVHWMHEPIGYGVASFVLIVPYVTWFEWAPHSSMVLSVVCTAVALVVVAVLLIEKRAVITPWAPLAVVVTVALGVATWPVPGVMASFLVLALAVRARAVLLLGAGVTGLVGYGGYYWFQLGAPPIPKFAALVGVGVVFAALFGVTSWQARRVAA